MSTSPSSTINALKSLGKKTITKEASAAPATLEAPLPTPINTNGLPDNLPPPIEQAEGAPKPNRQQSGNINPAPKPSTSPKMQQPIIQKPQPKTQYNLTAGMNHNKPKVETAPKDIIEGTPSASPAEQVATNVELSDEQVLERVKKMGYNVAPAETETPEQKQKRVERETKEYYAFSLNEYGLTPEQLAQPERIKGMSDMDLAYADARAKDLKANPDIKEETSKRRFAKMYNQTEFTMEVPEEGAETEDIKKYADAKKDWEEERAWGEKLIKQRAEKLREKAMAPLNESKNQFDNKKKIEQIDYKVDKEVDTFAQQFGKEFIYESGYGNIPIEVPDDYKKDLINKIRSAVKYLQRANPQGTVDIAQMANNQMAQDFRKQIDGVLYAEALNKGKAEARIGRVNPITEPAGTGVPAASKEQQAKAINKEFFKKRNLLSRQR